LESFLIDFHDPDLVRGRCSGFHRSRIRDSGKEPLIRERVSGTTGRAYRTGGRAARTARTAGTGAGATSSRSALGGTAGGGRAGRVLGLLQQPLGRSQLLPDEQDDELRPRVLELV